MKNKEKNLTINNDDQGIKAEKEPESEAKEKEKTYEDIIGLPHHVSTRHPQMPIKDRAAQFAPFAALTGHKEAIKETERLTDKRVVLDENAIALLNEEIQILVAKLEETSLDKTNYKNYEEETEETGVRTTITYFKKDERKEGGVYVTVTSNVKKIDQYQRQILTKEGEVIPLKDVVDIKMNR